MKKLLSTHFPRAHSLAGIAHDILLETHRAATTKVSDIRSQVEELWEAAGEKIPRKKADAFMRRAEAAWQALRYRDTIVFPASKA